jgi:hypothetical protein
MANKMPPNTIEINFTGFDRSGKFAPPSLCGCEVASKVWIQTLTVIGVSSRFPCPVATMVTSYDASGDGVEKILRDMIILESLLNRAKTYYLQKGRQSLYSPKEAIDVLDRHDMRIAVSRGALPFPQRKPARKYYLGYEEIPQGLYEWLEGLGRDISACG